MGHKGSNFAAKRLNHGGINPCWEEPSPHIWRAIREERQNRQAGYTPRTNGANPHDATPVAVKLETPAVSPSTQGASAFTNECMFINACIDQNRLRSFSGYHGIWQQIADGIMENALGSHAVAATLSTPADNRTQKFSEALLQSVLRIAIETDQPRSKPHVGMRHDFLLDRNANGAELKPHVADTICKFAEFCSNTHGALLDGPTLNGKTAHR